MAIFKKANNINIQVVNNYTSISKVSHEESEEVIIEATKGNLEFSSQKRAVLQGFGKEGIKEEECKEGIIKIKNKVIGKTMRNPGFKLDGTKAEDMFFADRPVSSGSIQLDPVFKLNDAKLESYLDQLMTSLSIGDMESVALEMSDRFKKGTGGTYKSEILNKEIAGNAAFTSYHNSFANDLKNALKNHHYDPSSIEILTMKLLNFSSFWDKVSGLGITVHQVWSVKAEIQDYSYNKCTKAWKTKIKYIFYDHFGLDWDDIKKHGGDRIPQYHTGDFFKAWYILQHYRSAKPFFTEITEIMNLEGSSNN
ncbi:DUF3289 family protein [Kaistella jeonii]|uniref:DUF3289 family protein n=1 Tax=Kaistella jeonii TaxID=266749 RepID=A0A0C1F7W5_9FLAO|nr:DUF3289 family protein [Kaistella jeonii]KIA84139.1 hypothetical protein OA86_14890 [Kaistella jeonii]SFC44267.1 Protein of unknown function [Kaistella jeonii]VEI97371.1 Protein of uncharacterised function (DUF3289) [Kaistella jeonii]